MPLVYENGGRRTERKRKSLKEKKSTPCGIAVYEMYIDTSLENRFYKKLTQIT